MPHPHIAAAERLAELDRLPAIELCCRALVALEAVVAVMSEETTLLRAGRFGDAQSLTADKARLSQDYVTVARSVQREAERLKLDAPADLERLKSGHERLATQMAENLRVIATARKVTDDILTDVAHSIGQEARPRTYGASGVIVEDHGAAARGIAVNRAL